MTKLLGAIVGIVIGGVVVTVMFDSLVTLHSFIALTTLLICTAFISHYWGKRETPLDASSTDLENPPYYLLTGIIPWALGILIFLSLAILGNTDKLFLQK
ncbi:hypothetical protein M1N24_01080 [Dehalococcoidia bacterium]|nr:hypothetical protein [Dehalococcoidia bacterium]